MDSNLQLHTIGHGACGTVWASETGPAYKREDGSPSRSLQNDFEMHRRVIRSHQTLATLKEIKIQIPTCHNFIKAVDKERCLSVSHHLENLLDRFFIQGFCSNEIKPSILNSKPDGDCLVRLYLGRRRTQMRTSEALPRLKVFSLRNYPLHEDQMEQLGISTNDMHQYAQSMAEALAMMHWVAGIDGNDVEFVLAPSMAMAMDSLTILLEIIAFGC
ncbi:uncharacterized protein N7529_009169 [Penicillium soppii]|uniref:uncharacterized protein n=1 Tax=Penicillium soppii TaxID=69789 RepID=UPI00254824B2|nr:uncharacterized protein N7529_009169 [Penicillium soppii]KAJ5861859.1 hypothetical protein N7529_009169 [Penicillium soppii]